MTTIQQSEINYVNNYNCKGKSVIIIGSGPSGILSTRYISERNNVLCVEGKADVGGLWNFDELTEDTHPNLQTNAFYNSYGVLQSSLYENLVCNGNKCIMAYKGLPPKREYDEYMKSDQFFSYLKDYSAMHNTKKFTTFQTFVQTVRLSKNLTDEERASLDFSVTKRFLVELVDANDYNSNIRYLQADHIVVCTGHYSVPNYPEIDNQNIFSGDLIHMHYFRKSKVAQYANKHLVVYGAGLSAQDVCYILFKKSGELKPSKITVIGHKNLVEAQAQAEAYADVIANGQLVFKSGTIKRYASHNSIELDNGEIVENIDNMLYATGYQFSYPFLEKYAHVDNMVEFFNTRKNAFGPLYKRMFSVREPNLIFIGAISVAFALQACIERMAIVAQRYIDGIISLPTEEKMLESFNEDYSEACKSHPDGRNYLKVTIEYSGFNDFSLFNQLQELAQMPYDEDFQKTYTEIIYPLYYKIFTNGNYPILKSLNYRGLLDPDYAPKTGLF